MPGLLTLRTDLKSLKYGHDQPGDGSSRQPYIKVDINDVDNTFNTIRLTRFDDGLIRGGAVGAINASAVDTLRIGKFLKDFPKGPLFIAKQVGLQLSNPQIEHLDNLPTNRTGTNLASSIGAFLSNTANRIENAVGPTRLYNLGINTLAQVPVNAFGGHIVRHGFLPNNDASKLYENVVTQNNFVNGNNRLEKYAGDFALGPNGGFGDGVRFKEKSVWNDSTILTKYISGPGSVYGIGSTLINRYVNTENKTAIYRALDLSTSAIGRIATIHPSQIPSMLPLSNTKSGSIFIADDDFGARLSNDTPYTLNDIIWKDFAGNPIQGGSSRKTRNTITLGSDIRLSNKTESKYSDKDFPDLPTSFNSSSQLIDNTGTVKDKSNPNKPSLPPVVINNTIDFGVSKTSGSIFNNRGFNLTNSLPSNSPFLFYVASNKDTGSHARKGNLPQLNSNNDLVKQGPSSYPGASTPANQLGVPNTVYNYGSSPAAKTYASIQSQQQQIQASQQTNFKFLNKPVSILKGAKNYVYNTGAKVSFNRKNDRELKEDEIKVIFTPINPFTNTETPTQFLAYLTNYSENYDSTWADITYAGRAEKFYIFNNFKRTINFGLQVPCYNKEELYFNHSRLFGLGQRGLAYALAGQYNENNLLGGIITKLTVGRYIEDSPGIINSMKFDIIEGSSWDLDVGYAFYLKVDFNFTVIGNKLPMYENYSEEQKDKDKADAEADIEDAEIVNQANQANNNSNVASVVNNPNATSPSPVVNADGNVQNQTSGFPYLIPQRTPIIGENGEIIGYVTANSSNDPNPIITSVSPITP